MIKSLWKKLGKEERWRIIDGLQKETGKRPSTIDAWMNERRRPFKSDQEKIAKYFDEEPGKLFP